MTEYPRGLDEDYPDSSDTENDLRVHVRWGCAKIYFTLRNPGKPVYDDEIWACDFDAPNGERTTLYLPVDEVSCVEASPLLERKLDEGTLGQGCPPATGVA